MWTHGSLKDFPMCISVSSATFMCQRVDAFNRIIIFPHVVGLKQNDIGNWAVFSQQWHLGVTFAIVSS